MSEEKSDLSVSGLDEVGDSPSDPTQPLLSQEEAKDDTLESYPQPHDQDEKNYELGKYDPTEKPYRSLLVLSVGFWCIFTAYSCLQNIESTLVPKGGLGTYSIGVLYLVNIFVSYVAKDFVADEKVGPKRAMVLGAAQYVVYTTANLLPKWYTLMPAAVLIGSGAGILWVGQGTMLSRLARQRALQKGETDSKSMCEFNGVFWSIFASTQVSGNLIGYVIFMFGDKSDLPIRPVKIFLYVLIVSGVIGVFTLQFLPGGRGEGKNSSSEESKPRYIYVGIPQKYFLLLPLFFFSGLYSAFEWNIFTSKVITHSYGDNSHGKATIFLVMAVFGFSTAATSITLGHLTNGLRHIMILFIGNFVLIAGVCSTLVAYDKFNDDITGYLPIGTIAIVLGYCDSVWNAQISAMLGIMFPDSLEEAFSAWKVFQNIGTSLMFFIQPHVSLYESIIIVGATLVISVPIAVVHLFKASSVQKPKILVT